MRHVGQHSWSRHGVRNGAAEFVRDAPGHPAEMQAVFKALVKAVIARGDLGPLRPLATIRKNTLATMVPAFFSRSRSSSCFLRRVSERERCIVHSNFAT